MLESLVTEIAAQADLDAAIATLLSGLAARIKATSNDQNIQRLARELDVAVPALTRAIAKQPA